MMKDDLQSIPGIGVSLAGSLRSIGIKSTEDLKNKDPEALYKKLCKKGKTDRCVLYTFRCAVYYASGGKDKKLLKWWNWKD
jgi:nucleotidyltransferase/DNA polymerase involved in DNA repair